MLVKMPKRMSRSFSFDSAGGHTSATGLVFLPALAYLGVRYRDESHDTFWTEFARGGTKRAVARRPNPRGGRAADRGGGLREHLGVRRHRARMADGGPAHRAGGRGDGDPLRRAGDRSPSAATAQSGGARAARADDPSGVGRPAAARRRRGIDRRGFRGARSRLRLAL